ncbi:aggregation-promoting factor C-terminal-like domain-containing protein [Salininema proteolyticum]|uniref:Lytic transglycosylase domain-containing protein n=1 Tax=Salininema proteolyticum TaxID=1607685 RepID=A0ABV8U2E2_9ACTN
MRKKQSSTSVQDQDGNGRHRAERRLFARAGNVVGHRAFMTGVATIVATVTAVGSASAIGSVDDRTVEEKSAQAIVADGIAASYDWQEVETMDSIIQAKPEPKKEKKEEKPEPEPEPAEEPEPEPQQAEPEQDSGPAISGDCSAYSGNKALGCTVTLERGMGMNEVQCLINLWDRESGWNESASNPSSGAYGIPQALPGDKMAANGSDWATNPATQIEWGLDYIEGRYGTPCGAWGHSEANGWY